METRSAEPDPAAGGASSIARATASGALWLSAASATTQVLVFVANVIVARHLGETEYGSAAMAMVVVALAAVFVSFGFQPAIATGRLAGTERIATAHWLTAGAGVALAALVAGASPIAAAFFENPQVTGLLVVAALGIATGAWESAPQAALQAAGRFDRVAYVTVAGQLAMTVTAISMALLGAGVWALIVPTLAGSALRAVAFTALSPARIATRLAIGEVRPFFREFGQVTGIAITDYLFMNADKVIVGKVLGEALLGRYHFGYSLVNRSLAVFTKTLGTPLLVSLGQLRGDPQAFDRAVVRTVLALVRLTSPIAIGGALVATDLVHVLVGSHWDGAVVVVQLFFVLSAVQAVAQLTGSVWLALGHARLLFWFGLVVNGLMLVVCGIGTWIGSPEAVVAGFILHSVVAVLAGTAPLTRRVCRVPLLGIEKGLLAVARDTGGMALAVYAVRAALLAAGAPQWCVLAVSIAVGGLVYTLLFRVLSSQELRHLLAVVPPRLARPALRLLLLR